MTTKANERKFATFKMPVYSGRVIVCLTRPAFKKIRQEADGYEEGAELEHTYGVQVRTRDKKKNESVYIIGWFDKKLSTLVHELAHLTFDVLTYSGVRVSKSNDEAFAYLIDALLDETLSASKVASRRK